MGADVTVDCPFCRIIDGSDVDAQVVGEGKGWVAFFPLHPATRGHTLVVPRVHVSDFWQADQRTAADLAVACIEVGRALDAVLTPDGMNLITSAGDVAEQTVFHLHFHIVPRWQDDDVDRIWPSPTDSAERASDALTEAVRRSLGWGQGA